jgi:hypothetical protein
MRVWAVVVFVLLAGPVRASAQPVPLRLVEPPGKVSAAASMYVGLDQGALWMPVTLSPDLFVGVASKLDVGIANSGSELTGFWGAVPGHAFCLHGLCTRPYGDVGALARYLVEDGPQAVAADAGVIVDYLDGTVTAHLGVKGRYASGRTVLTFAPSVDVQLDHRDVGYGETLWLPVTASYAATSRLALSAQTGLGVHTLFGNTIPVGVAATVAPTHDVTVEGSFTLPWLPFSTDARDAVLTVAWHD